jgi:hypothetical protein
MADTSKYMDYALSIEGTAAPFEPGSLSIGNDAVLDRIKSGLQLTDDLIQVIRKQPMIRATLLDPSLVTAWTELSTGVVATFRAYEQNGGLGSTYKKFTAANGVIMPVSLQAAVDRKAMLEVLCMAAFSAGTAIAIAATSGSPATVTKAYYPTSLTITSAITQLRNINVNWQYAVQNDDQLEPAYWYYDRYTMTGDAMVKDLDEVTAARLEDGSEESVTALLTDANNGSNTVSVPLGTCKVFATVQGDMARLSFEKLA